MIKRIAAFLLILVLLVGVLPHAFAEEITNDSIPESEPIFAQPLVNTAADEYSVMALASTQTGIMLFDFADNGNYTTVLNSQVTCTYKPNGTDTTRTAFVKHIPIAIVMSISRFRSCAGMCRG